MTVLYGRPYFMTLWLILILSSEVVNKVLYVTLTFIFSIQRKDLEGENIRYVTGNIYNLVIYFKEGLNLKK